jgi:S-adenosyl methyltransferase
VAGNTDWIPAEVDTETPSAARLYDYYLGGGYHFESDRQLAQQIYQVFPEMPHLARVNRAFLRRATEFCARQGITQFLDIGCGLPTTGAVHETAQAINPDAKVVYVDNEPVAVAHSELILENNPNATVLQADLRDPDTILNHPETLRMLDLSKPIALLVVAVVHFVPDSDNPAGLLAHYRDALPDQSYLAFSHVSGDTLENVAKAAELYRSSQNPAYLRSKVEISAMLDGFDLVEPGLVFVPEWRPSSPEDAEDAQRCSFYGAVGQRSR